MYDVFITGRTEAEHDSITNQAVEGVCAFKLKLNFDRYQVKQKRIK